MQLRLVTLLATATAAATAVPTTAAAAPARHGDPVAVASLAGPWPLNGNALAGAARDLRITYKMLGVNGRLVNATGTLALPRGRAPRGGWPVFSWAHGTTGIADKCAPSHSNLDSGSNALLNRIVPAGFVVARTDYEGLGSPGEHPYLNGSSEGRSVLDIVRAARKRYRSIGGRLEIGGHSQGGHAALWAASLAKTYTPELRLGGTLASAPASHHADRAPLIRMLDSSDLSPLVALILRGVDIGDPSLQIGSKLTAEARALWPLTLREYPGLDHDMLQSDARPVTDALAFLRRHR